MKNKKEMIMIVLMMMIITSSAFAETQPILQRLSGDQYYPIVKIKELAKGSTEKSRAFLDACLIKVKAEYEKKGKGFNQPLTVKNIDWICSKLKMEEIQLRKEVDVNSLWDTETKSIGNFTTSTDYDGPGWVFHDYENDVHFVFLKGNCLNILWISEDGNGFDIPVVIELNVVDEVQVKKVTETIYDTIYLFKTVYVSEEEIHQPMEVGIRYQDQYYPSNNTLSFQMWIPICAPQQQMGGGSYQYTDNSYYNSVVNNYYNTTNHNYYEVPDPEPVDPGGPAPAPGHDDEEPGGPAPVPGHNEQEEGPTGGFTEKSGSRGNVGSGSARVTREPVNDAQKSFQRSRQQTRSGTIANSSANQRSNVAQRSNQTQQQRSNQSRARSTSKGTPNPGYRTSSSQRSDVTQRSNQTKQRSAQSSDRPQVRSTSKGTSNPVYRDRSDQPKKVAERPKQIAQRYTQQKQSSRAPVYNEQRQHSSSGPSMGKSSARSGPPSGGGKASRSYGGGGSKGAGR